MPLAVLRGLHINSFPSHHAMYYLKAYILRRESGAKGEVTHFTVHHPISRKSENKSGGLHSLTQILYASLFKRSFKINKFWKIKVFRGLFGWRCSVTQVLFFRLIVHEWLIRRTAKVVIEMWCHWNIHFQRHKCPSRFGIYRSTMADSFSGLLWWKSSV